MGRNCITQICPVVIANRKIKILVAKKDNLTVFGGLDTYAHGQMCLVNLPFRPSQFNQLGCWLAAEICTYSPLPLFLFIVLITGYNNSQVIEGWSYDRIIASGFENNLSLSQRRLLWQKETISLSHSPALLTLSFNCPQRAIS